MPRCSWSLRLMVVSTPKVFRGRGRMEFPGSLQAAVCVSESFAGMSRDPRCGTQAVTIRSVCAAESRVLALNKYLGRLQAMRACCGCRGRRCVLPRAQDGDMVLQGIGPQPSRVRLRFHGPCSNPRCDASLFQSFEGFQPLALPLSDHDTSKATARGCTTHTHTHTQTWRQSSNVNPVL
jgi:hypothetical protein